MAAACPEALVLALQLHARGWSGADEFFVKGIRQKIEKAPRRELRLVAWNYWDRRLLDSTTDYWPAASPQMKALLNDEPDLGIPEHRALLKSLDAALVPGKGKPGSVEWLIDDLVNVNGIYERYGWFDGFSDPRFAQVFDLGFEAVPALIEHLDDDRLTRCRKPRNYDLKWSEPAYHYRVRDVASDLVQMIAGTDRPERKGNPAGEKLAAAAWWDKARNQGEEAYLLAHVLPSEAKDERPNSAQVRLLGKKYPRAVARVYREVLENRPRIDSWALAEAVATSSLSREEKVELFALAAGNKNLDHRCTALWKLKDLEAERFVTLLVATLDGLPRTPVGPYRDCREATFATLVCTTDDPRAWRALERAARQADPGLRMEMLRKTDYPPPTPTQRRLRMSFLAAFLDDETVCDTSVDRVGFDGFHEGCRFPRLEVRNFAAMRISTVVKMPADPTPEWSAADWAKFRDRIRAAAADELGRNTKER
jgi:hypothetical protein